MGITSRGFTTFDPTVDKTKQINEYITKDSKENMELLNTQLDTLEESIDNKIKVNNESIQNVNFIKNADGNISKIMAGNEEINLAGIKGEKGDAGTASVAIDDEVINTQQTWTSEKINDTIVKYTDDTNSKLEQIKYYVTPEMYGAKGDGITDDTMAINNCIADNYGGYILSKPNKTYLISGEILINDVVELNFNGSTIKCNSPYAVIKAYNPSDSNKIATIRNLIINGNHIAQKGIYITAFRILQLYNVTVKNCINCCIHVLRDNVTGRGSFNGNTLFLENEDNEKLSLLTNSIGIIFDSTDCKIENATSKNFLTHLSMNMGMNFIKAWHAWNLNSSNAEIINESKFAIINASANFDNCYSDTLQYAFYCTLNSQYIYVNLNNFNYYINRTQYPPDKNQPLPIYNKNCIQVKFNITNSIFDNEWNNYTPIPICYESYYVSISQTGLKGFINQVNTTKVKFRSFSLTNSEGLSIDGKRIFHINSGNLYVNLNGGLSRPITAGENLQITITESDIINKYSERMQNNIPCICKVKNGDYVYNVNAFYANNKFYLSFPEAISTGLFSLIMISNYNANETNLGW